MVEAHKKDDNETSASLSSNARQVKTMQKLLPTMTMLMSLRKIRLGLLWKLGRIILHDDMPGTEVDPCCI